MKNFYKTHENTIYIVLYALCNLILMGIFVWCTTPLMLYPLAVLWFGGFAIHALLMARKHLTESPNEKVKKMLDDIVWKLQHEPTCVLRLSFENIKMRNAFYQLMVDPEDGFLQDMYEMAADRAPCPFFIFNSNLIPIFFFFIPENFLPFYCIFANDYILLKIIIVD